MEEEYTYSENDVIQEISYYIEMIRKVDINISSYDELHTCLLQNIDNKIIRNYNENNLLHNDTGPALILHVSVYDFIEGSHDISTYDVEFFFKNGKIIQSNTNPAKIYRHLDEQITDLSFNTISPNHPSVLEYIYYKNTHILMSVKINNHEYDIIHNDDFLNRRYEFMPPHIVNCIVQYPYDKFFTNKNRYIVQ